MPAFRSVCPFLSKSLRTFGVIQSGSYDENQRISRLFGQQAFKENPVGQTAWHTHHAQRFRAFNDSPKCVRIGQQAFKENPEGVASSQPGASDRRERHPGLPRCVSDTPPKGAKAATEAFLPLLLPPPGAIFFAFRATRGVARCARLPRAGSLQPLRGFP